MAVTITRTAWIDDDGSGTTGTVINNAVKTDLYNQIDTALAKVAQLAGGNTFTNQQTIFGDVCINASSSIAGGSQCFVAADNSVHIAGIGLQNLSATPSLYFLLFYNNVGGLAGFIQQTGATTVAYTTSSDQRLKDDAGPAADLSALRALVIHDFTWKADGTADRGIFAQDAHALYPRAVVPGTDETATDGSLAHPWATDYSKFVPDLIVGWQQHDADLAELRAALATLNGSAG
jgi:hypothetical protein